MIIQARDDRRLHTRVIDIDALLLGPRTPVVADIVDKASISNSVLDQLLAFDELESKAHGYVPTNVTVHKPDTGIISEESNDKMTALSSRAITGHESYITTGRVVKVECGTAAVVAISCCENVEVVTVQMDGVTKWYRRFDDHVDPLSKGSGDSEIARVSRDGVVVDDAVESCITPVGLESGSVEVPAVKVDAVGV